MSNQRQHTPSNSDTGHSQLADLAILADGLTGADIERLVREFRGRCRRQRQPMTWNGLAEALRQARPAPPPALMLPIAIHEIGHALAYELFGIGHVDTVQIGGARGGQTRIHIPLDRVQDEQGTVRMIACLLAGRTAERLVLGTFMMGSGGEVDSDLARATTIALQLETALGVGEDMPLLFRPPANPNEALLYQPELARRVHRRLTVAEDLVQQKLQGHLTVLSGLAEQLVGRSILDGDIVRKAIKAGGQGDGT